MTLGTEWLIEATGCSEALLRDETAIRSVLSAVIDELASTMQITIARPGEQSPLETTSACRWESPRFYDWLISRGESDATARGLVIVSNELIDKGLKTHLETAAAKLTRLQNG